MRVLWARCMLAACTHHSILCTHTTCVPYCSRVASVECITPAEPTAHRPVPAPGRPSPPPHCTCQSCAEARPNCQCACRCSLASAISHAPPARPPPPHQRVQHCHAPLSGKPPHGRRRLEAQPQPLPARRCCASAATADVRGICRRRADVRGIFARVATRSRSAVALQRPHCPSPPPSQLWPVHGRATEGRGQGLQLTWACSCTLFAHWQRTAHRAFADLGAVVRGAPPHVQIRRDLRRHGRSKESY